jgi:hypothetical protein
VLSGFPSSLVAMRDGGPRSLLSRPAPGWVRPGLLCLDEVRAHAQCHLGQAIARALLRVRRGTKLADRWVEDVGIAEAGRAGGGPASLASLLVRAVAPGPACSGWRGAGPFVRRPRRHGREGPRFELGLRLRSRAAGGRAAALRRSSARARWRRRSVQMRRLRALVAVSSRGGASRAYMRAARCASVVTVRQFLVVAGVLRARSKKALLSFERP